MILLKPSKYKILHNRRYQIEPIGDKLIGLTYSDLVFNNFKTGLDHFKQDMIMYYTYEN